LGTVLFVRLPEQEAEMQKQTDNRITAFYYRSAAKNTDNLHLDNQMQLLLCCAKERGLDRFMLYADNGASGVTCDRPALNALKADIRAGRVGEIIIADSARLGRDFIALNGLIEWLQSYGVEIVSLKDGGRVEPFCADMAALCRSLLKGGERA
jgi:site-specific DNA recombinase